MVKFKTSKEVEEFVYNSYVKYLPKIDHSKEDKIYRNPNNTKRVLELIFKSSTLLKRSVSLLKNAPLKK